MKLSPHLVLRACLLLLGAVMAGGLAANLPALRPAAARPAASPSVAAPLRFVIVAPLYDHPFWAQVNEGARAAAGDLQVNVEFTGPRHAAVTEQVQLLDMATAAQVDGVITQGVPDPRVAQAIAKAVDRGIPVITVETDLAGGPSRRLTYIGSDNYQAGRLAAEELILRTGGQAVVGIVRGHFGPEELDPRVAGFRAGLAGAPGVRIAAVESSDLNRTVAGQMALKILNEHPEVTALYATTALDAVGVVQSVTALGMRSRIFVVGWGSGGGPEDALMHGALPVMAVEDPTAMGRRAVAVLEAYLRRDVRPARTILIPVIMRSGGEER